MRVTQWGELGVLCAIEVARRAASDTPSIAAPEIANALKIDIRYAQQILHRLKRGGILKSTRGPKGGYELIREPAETSLREILSAAEGQTFEVICETRPLDEERCNPNHACNLRPIWLELREHINSFLNRVSLQDLTAQPVETILVQISHPKLSQPHTV